MERRRSSYFRSNTKEIEESNIQQQNNNLLLQKNLSEDLGEEGSKENRYEESENSIEPLWFASKEVLCQLYQQVSR